MAEAAAASADEHDDKMMVGVSMTPEEKAKLEEFCKLFPKKHLPDTYHKHSLWRFLSARNYDIPAAEKMLREHFEWRVQIEADSALSWTPPTVLTEYLATGWFGKDKSGNLVRYERPGIIDFRGLFRAARRPDLVKYRSAYMMEDALKKLDEASVAKGSRVSGITFIVDMAGFGPSKIYRPGITFVREIFRLLESNYPQVLEKVFIVNPPGIFPVVFGLVSKFMDERTRRKFTVVKNLDTLLEHFDADQLPQIYGGSAKNPDGAEGSPKFSGGMVPPSMYLSSQLSSDNLRTVNIGRFSRVEIPIDIVQVKSVIKWEFVTDHDVNFGLYKQTSESNQSLSAMECVIAMKVVQGKGLPEEGGHECEEIGRYVFVLDNSFGLLFSRDVRYNLQVITPDGEITDINTDSTTTTTEPAAGAGAAGAESS